MYQHEAGDRLELNLGVLAPPASLWPDRDRDGYPDALGLGLLVHPALRSGRLWAALCNLAARLAMHTLAFDPPLARLGRRSVPGFLLVVPPTRACRPAARLLRRGGGWLLEGHSAAEMARLLESLALAPLGEPGEDLHLVLLKREGLDRAAAGGREMALVAAPPAEAEAPATKPGWPQNLLAAPRAFLRAAEGSPRSLILRLGLELPRRLPARLGLELVELAARSALEATEAALPLAWSGPRPHAGPLLRLEPAGAGEARVTRESGNLLLARGPAPALARLVAQLRRLWFDAQGPGGEVLENWLARAAEAHQLVRGQGTWGRWAHRLAQGGRRPLPPVPAGQRARVASACRALGLEPPPLRRAERPLVRRTTWKDECRRVLQLVQGLPPGEGAVRGLVLVSKPARRRRELARELEGLLRDKGYRPRLRVLGAYKPGLSWLLEEVAPAVPRRAVRARLSARPFDSGRPGQMELPSRWIQECYPGPDLLARRLGWDAEQVELSLEPEQEQTYRFRAWDVAGELVLDRGFTPRTSRLPFLPGRPQAGWVHPTCASITLLQGEQILLDQTLPSDREVFWRRFQQRWLPELERRMKDMLPRLRAEGGLAFWEELRVEVAIPESQQRLGLDEERLAPLEALHEDLYFGLLEFIQAFNQEQGLERSLHLGRIVPVVNHDPQGDPWARLTARPLRQVLEPGEVSPQVQHLGWRRGRLVLGFEGGGLSSARRRRLCRVAAAWGHRLEPGPAGDFLWSAPAPAQDAPRRFAPPTQAPPQDRILSGEEIRAWTRRLGALPGLRAWRAGHSWQGREILALEAHLPAQGCVSLGKLRLLKPTLLLNARHHANEVSSSNAALALAWKLARDPERRRLLERVNLVMVPLENADGVATLEELLPGAPDHKLHAARFNALGVEWYQYYFDPDPPFPEARVKARLFRRWLPRNLMDAHGVPSHEWEQPFAGYLNPRYREHWIPWAFVFAILPYLDQPDHPAGQRARELAKELARAMSREKEITRLGKRIHQRYRRYAMGFEPQVFQAEFVDSLLVVPPARRLGQTNFAQRYWPLVESEVVTEVLDEVTRGSWLELCCRAHQVVALALMERLARTPPARLRHLRLPHGVRLAWRR